MKSKCYLIVAPLWRKTWLRPMLYTLVTQSICTMLSMTYKIGSSVSYMWTSLFGSWYVLAIILPLSRDPFHTAVSCDDHQMMSSRGGRERFKSYLGSGRRCRRFPHNNRGQTVIVGVISRTFTADRAPNNTGATTRHFLLLRMSYVFRSSLAESDILWLLSSAARVGRRRSICIFYRCKHEYEHVTYSN